MGHAGKAPEALSVCLSGVRIQGLDNATRVIHPAREVPRNE